LRDTAADRQSSALGLVRPKGYDGSRNQWRNSENSWAAPVKDGLSLRLDDGTETDLVRIAMLKHGIKDLRLFHTDNLRFLCRFT